MMWILPHLLYLIHNSGPCGSLPVHAYNVDLPNLILCTCIDYIYPRTTLCYIDLSVISIHKYQV